MYSRGGTTSGIGRTASAGCSGPGELVSTAGSVSSILSGYRLVVVPTQKVASRSSAELHCTPYDYCLFYQVEYLAAS